MSPDPGNPAHRDPELSRRAFLTVTGGLGLAVALGGLPNALTSRGLLGEAKAADPDVVHDTLNSMIAFFVPGSDEYSKAQGESAAGPGGVASGALGPLMSTFDAYVPASLLGQPSVTVVPASAGLATLLNAVALEIDPLAGNGPFLSPFARLSFKQKGEVFKRLESDTPLTGVVEELRFVFGILPLFASFLAFSEAGVYDSRSRRLSNRPVGWDIAGYAGPADGHREFAGYYQGRRSVRGGHRFVRHRRTRREAKPGEGN